MRATTDSGSGERGQVLALSALFMVVLLISASLAVDYASWLSARRDFQGVVDAAAIAAAAQLPAPGFGTVSAQQQQDAATDALVYLSDHLGWGIARATAQGNTAQFLNQAAPYVVTSGSTKYCVWIWTPTPIGSENTGTDVQCQPNAQVLYSPANYPASSHRVFVRIQQPRPTFFAGIAGFSSEIVSAIGVAGTAHTAYAVISLKTRLGNPDNQLGLTISGSTTYLTIPFGDVGSNYGGTCDSASNAGAVTFTNSALEQTVDLQEPSPISSCLNSNVTGGTIQRLPDYPIADPAYFAPLPTWCTGALSGECSEPSGAGTASWPFPPAANYPSCANATDITKHQITKCTSGTFTVYPGKYELISVPNGATAILSPNCFGSPADLAANPLHTPPDSDCITNGRAGVFYFASNASQAGISVANGGKLYGCGVLTIFDPNETGGTGKMQFDVSGSNAEVRMNDSTVPGGCSMKYDPGNLAGTTSYVWYGYNQPFQNPVTMWVRPNGNGYNMSGSGNGSHVINFHAGAALFEGGAIYGPQDNTQVSGGPSGSGVGQIVSWTVTYTGGAQITETFQGPGISRTRLWQ